MSDEPTPEQLAQTYYQQGWTPASQLKVWYQRNVAAEIAAHQWRMQELERDYAELLKHVIEPTMKMFAPNAAESKPQSPVEAPAAPAELSRRELLGLKLQECAELIGMQETFALFQVYGATGLNDLPEDCYSKLFSQCNMKIKAAQANADQS